MDVASVATCQVGMLSCYVATVRASTDRLPVTVPEIVLLLPSSTLLVPPFSGTLLPLIVQGKIDYTHNAITIKWPPTHRDVRPSTGNLRYFFHTEFTSHVEKLARYVSLKSSRSAKA